MVRVVVVVGALFAFACQGGAAGQAKQVVLSGAAHDGEPAKEGSACASGFAADGVCCNKACTEPCVTCAAEGNVGTCIPVPLNQPPAHGTCAGQACDPTNAAATLVAACNGDGVCGNAVSTSCDNYTCDPATGKCRTACANVNDCVSPAQCDADGHCSKKPNGAVCDSKFQCASGFCVEGLCCDGACQGDCEGCFDDPGHCAALVCGNKSNGTACSVGGECQSGRCADGVCCDSTCTGQCEACDLAGSVGTCSPVPSGQPRGTRAACVGTGVCQGQCSAANRFACSYPTSSTTCGSAACSGTNKITAPVCNGSGTCENGSATSCLPYGCNAAGTDCDPGAGKVDGQDCTTGSCLAGHFCVDGVCCNSACTGKCEACDVPGSVGVCTPVPSGQPHGGRSPCSGTGACQAQCTGASTTACGAFPSGNQCRAQSCSGSTQTNSQVCNGTGTCPASTTTDCLPYGCDAGATACDPTAGKVQGQDCSSGTCRAGLSCVDNRCCNSACTGKCQACDVGGSLGTCTTVTSGQPHGSRGACAGSGVCQGSCTGASASACTFPGSGTSCRLQSCPAGTTQRINAAGCDGAGGCPLTTTSCGNYQCDSANDACYGSCTSNANCGSGTTAVSCMSAAAPHCSVCDCTGTMCSGTGVCATTCFPGETLVHTPDGPRRIDGIAAGDRVLGFDTQRGEAGVWPVLRVERRGEVSFVRVLLSDGSEIVSTPEHPFWVRGSGWVRAAELDATDSLLAPNGSAAALRSLESFASAAPTTVYNLVVDGPDDFFVGPTATLVHSCAFTAFSSWTLQRARP